MTAVASFNLIDEPWLPCVLVDGGAPVELSLRQALRSAPEVRDLSDPSPLVTVALHRLLLVILHRTFGPANARAWNELWQRGRWDQPTLDAYFDRWRARFDLFDEQRPFYQAASLNSARRLLPVAKLTHELASGNNATLFDHSTAVTARPFTPAQAARRLTAQQAFALAGTISRDPGESPAADAGPLAMGAVALVQGISLFQTLMLNLCHYSPNEEAPFAVDPGDAPAWERDDDTRAEDRTPRGYLDLLTWQSRRIWLRPEPDADGRFVVREFAIRRGYGFPDRYERRGHETMLGFQHNLKPKAGQEAWPVVRFHEDRALWRDSLALFQSVEGQQARPMLLDWLNVLVDGGHLRREEILPLSLAGLAIDPTNVAKALFWRHERLLLPVAFLGSDTLLDALRRSLSVAEQVGGLFQSDFGVVTIDGQKKRVPRPLHVLGQGLASASEERMAPADVVRRLVRHLAPGRRYWSRLEVPFRRLLVTLPDQLTGQNGVPDYEAPAFLAWVAEVERAARSAFEEATGSLDTSARALRAVALARRSFNWQLSTIVRPYREEEQSQITA